MKLSAYLLLIVFLVFASCKKEVKNTKETIVQNKNNEADISTIDFKTKIVEKNVQLIDVRTILEYNQGHIENATSIDFNNPNFLKHAINTLDKAKPVYVYCLAGGKRSQTSVKLLKEKGYDVYNLKDGFADWQKKGFKTIKSENNIKKTIKEVTTTTTVESVTPIKETTTKKEVKEVKEVIEKAVEKVQNKDKTAAAVNKEVEILKEEVKEEIVKTVKLIPEIIKVNTTTFKSKIEGKDVQLLDVRTPKEYKNAHIPKANNINIYDSDFVKQAKVLDKSKPVYVYCRSGVRSMKAANKLKDAGYTVYNLNGGIKAWQKEGNKTE